MGGGIGVIWCHFSAIHEPDEMSGWIAAKHFDM